MFNIFRGPIELLMGVVFGGLVGVLCWFLPNKTEVNIHMDTMCICIQNYSIRFLLSVRFNMCSSFKSCFVFFSFFLLPARQIS